MHFALFSDLGDFILFWDMLSKILQKIKIMFFVKNIENIFFGKNIQKYFDYLFKTGGSGEGQGGTAKGKVFYTLIFT